jgi:hypothetical protein
MGRAWRLWIAALGISVLAPQAAPAAIFTVNDDNLGPGPAGAECSTPDFNSIQTAIASPSVLAGNTIRVCAGTYGPAVLNKSLKLIGAQGGVDARGRAAPESVITGAGTLLELQTGSLGSTIDGFQFSGGAIAIDSSSGPLSGLTVANNRIVQFTGSGITLDHEGIDVTIANNVVDGASKVGGGQLVLLGTGSLDGFRLTDNEIVNGATATGLFSDGNRNVGISPTRAPLVAGNLIHNNTTGANLGTRSFEDALIRDNTFSEANFDGLQGGMLRTVITGNRFVGNGRSGLALTSFGNINVDRGAQNSEVTGNLFSGNTTEAIFLSATQPPGTISTNEIHFNRIVGTTGITYSGNESIDAENNWWGCNEGPGSPGCASIGGTSTTVDFNPWLTLGVTAVPGSVPFGGGSQITADLTRNSDGAVAGAGFPDGASVAFATDLGSVLNPVPTSGGQAISTFTAGTTAGTATVSAALDNELVTTPVTVQAGETPPDPTPDPDPVACENAIRGTRAANRLVGTEGPDRITGLGGSDRLLGLGGEDCLAGGSGDDRINGGEDADELTGGRGNDRIRARDGNAELVNCGPGGKDVTVVDGSDRVRGCERVRRP